MTRKHSTIIKSDGVTEESLSNFLHSSTKGLYFSLFFSSRLCHIWKDFSDDTLSNFGTSLHNYVQHSEIYTYLFTLKTNAIRAK